MVHFLVAESSAKSKADLIPIFRPSHICDFVYGLKF